MVWFDSVSWIPHVVILYTCMSCVIDAIGKNQRHTPNMLIINKYTDWMRCIIVELE